MYIVPFGIVKIPQLLNYQPNCSSNYVSVHSKNLKLLFPTNNVIRLVTNANCRESATFLCSIQ